MTELDVLADVVNRLEQAGIEYMLTGSMAMNYYAVPRMTRDIDIIIEMQIEDIPGIFALFNDDYYISEEGIKDALIHKTAFNIINYKSIIKIDFIIKKKSEYRQAEFKRRKQVKIDGFHVYIVSIEDLIISKLIWAKDSNSEIQASDVENLMAQKVDKDYLEFWKKKLGIGD
jgi:predicted nucleotidyltransferase